MSATVTKTRKGRHLSGDFETLWHRCSFWYDIARLKLSDDVQERLESHAEEHARESIIEGYCCGELNYSVITGKLSEREVRGWWEIVRSDDVLP